MKLYDFDNIIDVSRDSLSFLDDEGLRQEIDLKLSGRRLMETTGNEQMSDLLGSTAQDENSPVCVCKADKTAEKPYYEFFGEDGEIIKFEMEIRPGFLDYFRLGWQSRFYDRLEQFEKQLRLFGYEIYIL